MRYLNVSGFWKPSVKSNIFVYFHQHSIGNGNIKVRSGLHLELVHGVPGLGNVDLVVALHFNSLLLTSFRGFSSAVIALPLFHGISLLLSGKTGWKRENVGLDRLSRANHTKVWMEQENKTILFHVNRFISPLWCSFKMVKRRLRKTRYFTTVFKDPAVCPGQLYRLRHGETENQMGCGVNLFRQEYAFSCCG